LRSADFLSLRSVDYIVFWSQTVKTLSFWSQKVKNSSFWN
jgi:hypothetical protein